MYAALRWRCDVMRILIATLRGAVHQQQRTAAYAALLPSVVATGQRTRLTTAPRSVINSCSFAVQRDADAAWKKLS